MVDAAQRAALPSDDQLLRLLEQSVDDVFSTMVGTFEEAAVYPRSVPEERVGAKGEVELVLDPGSGERVQIDRQAVVEFQGALSGRVVLRCSAEGALDIARGLLMLDSAEGLALDEVNDALKECANMLTGTLKTKALDPHGAFTIGLPFLMDAPRETKGASLGALVYRLGRGAVSVEIWRAGDPS